jgi:hypothetical protein
MVTGRGPVITMRRSLVTVALTLLIFSLVGPLPAQAVEYPGGRRIYAVSLGAIPAPGTTGTTWVRLAYYYFFGDGTVTEAFWFWSRNRAVGAVNSGVTSAGCDNCQVRTAYGFHLGARALDGTYTNSGDTITINWSEGSRETWRVSHPASDLARMDFVSSNYGVTVGWAFGSAAPHDVYTPMGSIPRVSYRGRFAGVGHDGRGAAGPSVINTQTFVRCHGNCLSLLSAPSTACSTCPNGASSSPIRYYLAGIGRRTFYEHWCRCLTPSTCYTGGSHRKPMLQVIGDNGAFHGWVGVEASNFTANTGYFAVNYHVDVP